MLVYPSSIDLSTRTLRYLARQLTSRRQEIGIRWRRLTAGRQALLALAHLRCGDTYAQLAAGFGIGLATVYRCVREAIDVLAVLAPTLDEAMVTARSKAYVILDDTVLPIDWIAADGPDHSARPPVRHPSEVRTRVHSVTASSCESALAGDHTIRWPGPCREPVA